VYKVALFLEEAGLPWEPAYVEVAAGAQFDPAFRVISPNAKVPVLLDDTPTDGETPWPVWESGAILLYLAEKHGQFLPPASRQKSEVMQWLFWQMAGLGPMSGQHAHFLQYADLIPDNDYAKQRYARETSRLLKLLDWRLRDRPFVASEEYSIADMACYPWARMHRFLGIEIAGLPALSNWLGAVEAREATGRAYARIDALPRSTMTVEERYRIMCTERGGDKLNAWSVGQT
jgi:GST-like protein